jgi:hypothetical protein
MINNHSSSKLEKEIEKRSTCCNYLLLKGHLENIATVAAKHTLIILTTTIQISLSYCKLGNPSNVLRSPPRCSSLITYSAKITAGATSWH